MKNQKTYKALTGTALVLVLGIVLLFPTGCSRLLPTEPDALSKLDDSGVPPPFFKPGATDVACEVSASKWFDAGGGEMAVQNQCMAFEFKVPASALKSKVKVVANAGLYDIADGGAGDNQLVVDFGPDGLVFLKPASLILDGDLLKAAEGEILTLYWYNPDTGQWEIEQQVTINSAHATFDINHFSRYAIKGGSKAN
jgi:hypothetical protein